MTMPSATIPAAAPRAIAPAGTTARTRRIVGAVVAIAAAGILGVAAWLEPSPTGLGTHSQIMAMPPCGWIAMLDVPCPTCGMTTAFAFAAEGNLAAAAWAQPFGAALAVAVAVALVVGAYTALTGSRVAVLFTRLWGRRAAWGLGLGLGAAWVYKVLVYKGVFG
jgi:hypothetical protein